MQIHDAEIEEVHFKKSMHKETSYERQIKKSNTQVRLEFENAAFHTCDPGPMYGSFPRNPSASSV